MSAIYDYNNNNNFAPQGYYPSSQPRSRPSASAPSFYPSTAAAAPAAFSYSHHQPHAHYPSHASYPQQAPVMTTMDGPTAAPAAAATVVPVLAERYKTKFCKNYVQYHVCPYEERCMFAHGEGELRSVDDNVRDGLVTEEAIKSFQRQCRHAMLYQQQQQQQQEEMHYGAAHYEEEEEDARSTATIPKAVYVHQRHHHHHNQAATTAADEVFEVPVKEFVAPGVYRFNPYGTVDYTASAPFYAKGVSRSSSVDNFSSVAGSDDDEAYGWAEDSTPQKRPLMSL